MNNGEVGLSRGRGRGWQQQPENQPRELRRPRNVADENVEAPKSSLSAEAPKSNLSAEAKEWYPPNYNPQAPAYARDPAPYRSGRPARYSVQDRLRQAQDQNPYIFEDMSNSLDESENADLRENIANLITVMCEITFDPGKFDTLCGALVDSFASTLNDVNYTRPLVEAIVNQSIGESNFRYNGARLCSMYESVAPPDESTFRACLLERCAQEENKIISGLESNEDNIRGFAMFLAEIYTQLEDSQGGRITSLGESLCNVFIYLLDTDKEANIKAVCQLLKLSGIALDADCPAEMEGVVARLRRRAALPAVHRVLGLRAARWGLADNDPHHQHHAAMNNVAAPAEAGEGGFLADGAALTAEERAFLATHLPAREHDLIEEIENDSWDTGMDEEMQAGFLEFLKISNQIKR